MTMTSTNRKLLISANVQLKKNIMSKIEKLDYMVDGTFSLKSQCQSSSLQDNVWCKSCPTVVWKAHEFITYYRSAKAWQEKRKIGWYTGVHHMGVFMEDELCLIKCYPWSRLKKVFLEVDQLFLM